MARGPRLEARQRDGARDPHGDLTQPLAGGAEVVRGVGSFGGAFSAKALAAMDDRAAGIQIGIAEAQLAERQAAVEAQAVQVDRARRERDRLATLARRCAGW